MDALMEQFMGDDDMDGWEDMEPPTFDEMATFFQDLNLNLNFGQEAYDYLLNEFAPEDDPTTIGALMNWLGATSDQEQMILGELKKFYDNYYGMDMEPPTFDEMATFFADLEMNLNFGQEAYDYFLNEFAPEDDPTTIGGLMNWLGATSDQEQMIMDELKKFYDDYYAMDGDCDIEKPTFDEMATFFDELDLGLQLTQEFYD
jgi:hypothetical protein